MYSPSNPPTDPTLLAQYLVTEHAKIQAAIEQAKEVVYFVPLAAPPKRVKEGGTVMAINPWAATLSSGPGAYQYRGGSWRFLG